MSKQTETAPNWNPHATYTWKKRQVDAWRNEYGTWAFCWGEAWSLRCKSVRAGWYEVKFVRYNP